MYHYRTIREDHIKNQSFSSQLYSTLKDDCEKMPHDETRLENHVGNLLFSGQLHSIIEKES